MTHSQFSIVGGARLIVEVPTVGAAHSPSWPRYVAIGSRCPAQSTGRSSSWLTSSNSSPPLRPGGIVVMDDHGRHKRHPSEPPTPSCCSRRRSTRPTSTRGAGFCQAQDVAAQSQRTKHRSPGGDRDSSVSSLPKNVRIISPMPATPQSDAITL
jgi:hypothetical protein